LLPSLLESLALEVQRALQLVVVVVVVVVRALYF
tara:strand:+ start:124 stop:225 length:102 start_codon:yes stop_codon:yes gene_type:complete